MAAVRRCGVAWALATGVLLAMAPVASAASDKPAKKDLAPAARTKLVLEKGVLGLPDLSGVMATTPTPTTIPPAPAATTDVRKTFCAKPVAAVDQIERSASGRLTGDHTTNAGGTFSFVYATSEVNLFPTSAAAKQYMAEAAAAMAGCTSYFYGTASNERYIPQRGITAPKVGDESALMIATLAFPSGNSRDDVATVVRVGQLVSLAFLQISTPLTDPQLSQLARRQAERLGEVLGSGSKKAGSARKKGS